MDQDGIKHEGLIRGAFSGAPDEFYVLDLEGRIQEVNQAVLDGLGYALGELLGRGIWELSTRQTEDGFRRLAATLKAEGAQVLFGHNRCKDGQVYPVEARMWVETADQGQSIMAILRRAGGHEDLIEERDQLISLIDYSSEAITVTSPEGICSYINPAGRRMLGLAASEDVGGKPLAELYDARQAELISEHVLPAIRMGEWHDELQHTPLGETKAKAFWVNGFPIKHSQSDETIGLALMAHDISGRKRLELQRQRLLELNEVSRNVANSLLNRDDLNQAISIILNGVGSILDVQRAYVCRYRKFHSWVFRTHQWMKGDAQAQVVPPKPEDARAYRWITDMLENGEPIVIDDVSRAGMAPKPGSGVLRVDVKALLIMPVIIHGRLESFIGFTNTADVRRWEDQEVAIVQIIVDSFGRAIERRIAERERATIARDLEEAVARERSASSYKSQFLANMSHELRTPMNAIVGYAELLTRPNIEREKQELWAAHIQRSTGHLLSLVNDVLDISKIEAGEMSIFPEAVDLKELVAVVEDLLHGQAEEGLIKLEIECAPDVPSPVFTDPVRLRQILVNLVSNAIKFTPEGTVSLRVSTDSECASGLGLIFAVQDTGVGMNAEDMQKLFQPFIQLETTNGARLGGTGLGLDISRRLAHLLGGDIEVESELDKGSTFTLRLAMGDKHGNSTPERTGELGSSESSNQGEGNLKGRHILIVDDSPENRDVLGFLLEEAGCLISTAENGELGVEAILNAPADQPPVDLVLMDMNMPVLDGYGATERLVLAGCKIPIVALTAFALAGDEERCLEVGCVGYMTKPVQPSRFARGLENFLLGQVEPIESTPAAVEEEEDDVLSALLNNPSFQPLIKRYVGSFNGLIVELENLMSTEKLEGLCTGVHRLRGTAANYGFPEISKYAGGVEDLIRTEAPLAHIAHALDGLLEALRNASARTAL